MSWRQIHVFDVGAVLSEDAGRGRYQGLQVQSGDPLPRAAGLGGGHRPVPRYLLLRQCTGVH